MLQKLFAALPGFRTDPVRARRTLIAWEREASLRPLEQNAGTYKKMGDLCVDIGKRTRALSYYGRAIDACLLSNQYDEAEHLCRTVIAVVPDVVRTRCTLAFLTLRKGYSSAFKTELRCYVAAAKRAGEEKLAVTRLRLMAAVTHEDERVRLLIDEQIEQLGDGGDGLGGLGIMGAGFGPDGRRSIALPGNQRERWAFVLRLAITGPTSEIENGGNSA